MKKTTLLLAAIALLLASCAGQTNAPAGLPFQKGITLLNTWPENGYSRPESKQALLDLASTGADWVAIIVPVYQATGSDTGFTAKELTPSDESLIRIISIAHKQGLSVMLKPHVDILSEEEWRGEITFSSESEWQAWFASYRQMITHYADLAQQTHSETFCVGTELEMTSSRTRDWEAVLSEVRTHYSGKLTYASTFTEVEQIKWWSSLDYIGVDAYYPLPTPSSHPTAAELQQAWIDQGYLVTLERLAREYDRPVLLTEIGYRSIAGANIQPWDIQVSPWVDLELQANLYEAALETFSRQEWVAGMFFWNWFTDPLHGGITDTDFTPNEKPAEEILRSYYTDKIKTLRQ